MSLASVLADMDDMHERLMHMLAECPPRKHRESDGPDGYVTPPPSPIAPEGIEA